MIKTKPVILAVDDEKDMLDTYETILQKKYTVILSNSGKDALEKISKNDIDAVILDIRMPKLGGIEVLKKIRSLNPEIEVIMATASKDIASAVEAMKLSAFDYLTKPFDVKELLVVIEKAIEKRDLTRENEQLKEIIKSDFSNWELIGSCPKIKRIKELITTIAKTDSSVLIQGESGSGKEVAARMVHNLSSRKNKPFVAINCAAIPENLLESELFGYERGAFTGALERKLGKFEVADSGTLFLDEIGCMSPAMQSKLLRILEEKSFERLGGNSKIEVDIRILSATNIDFEKQIREGKFREDLFYRLNVIPIMMPPLRERMEDLNLFISFFVNKFNKEFNKKIKGVSSKVLEKLKSYDFPGNVRELQNLIERASAISSGDTIEEEHIFGLSSRNLHKDNPDSHNHDASKGLKESCESYEKQLIIKTLRSAEWNQTKTAEKLGIARTTLSSRIKALSIQE